MGKAWWLSGLVAVMALGWRRRPPKVPVGQWDLNEGAGTVAHNDFFLSSGKGTLEGGVAWIAGRFQSGLSFDGVDGQVDVPTVRHSRPPTSLSARGSRPMVVLATTDISSPRVRTDVAPVPMACTQPRTAVWRFTSRRAPQATSSHQAGTAIWDGKWHNVIGTFNGSSVRVYVDGRQVGSGSPDSGPIKYNLPTASDLVIGDYPWCPGLDFKGDIDEVKVFNRALSPAEISLGYQISNQLPYFFPFDVIL